MRRLHSILGNSQWLDGGAMFGNAPRALWTRWITPDEHNRIPLACRAMLVQDNNRHLLFETGIGSFFAPALKERYGVAENEHVLLKSLLTLGLSHDDIDIVVLSHLHFDHAGGLLSSWEENKAAKLLFPKAHYVVSEVAWERANHPHFRDRASFIPELNNLLRESGRLVMISGESSDLLGEGYRFHQSNGYTPGMLLSEIAMPQGPVTFAADLIPGTPWVHLPITMGYDRAPEQLIDEKEKLLNKIYAEKGWLFYTHDHQEALSQIAKNDKGHFMAINGTQELPGLT